MRSYDRIAGLFFLAVGAFFTLYARFVLYARRVEIGAWKEPDAGFLPFWGGLTLIVMSALLLVSSFSSRTGQISPSFFPVPDAWKRVLITFLSLAAYNLLLNPLGFTLTTFLFLGFLLKVIFPQGWRRTLLVAVIGSAVARFLFIDFLETQLPKGILGF
jgi:putative tricarboxylic transport membrane protein